MNWFMHGIIFGAVQATIHRQHRPTVTTPELVFLVYELGYDLVDALKASNDGAGRLVEGWLNATNLDFLWGQFIAGA